MVDRCDRLNESRMFEMIFSNKRELLELYNAMNGTHYEDPELLEINMLKNAVYMGMSNDVSFIIDLSLKLYEHQSTFSPNLPLRYLMYAADIYSAFTKDKNLYGTKVIRIPTPKFVIFYNGTEEQPDIQEIKLSEMYTISEEKPSLELTAVMININKGRNEKLLSTCRALHDYAEYTWRVREYTKEMSLENAVERAITECIREGILSDFLSKHRAEAKKVSIYEYDFEKHMRMEREDNLEEGKRIGIEALIKSFQEMGISRDDTLRNFAEKLKISREAAQDYMTEFWKPENHAGKTGLYEYDFEKHMRMEREDKLEEGKQIGVRKGIVILIETLNQMGISSEETLQKVETKFGLSREEAQGYVKEYWR